MTERCEAELCPNWSGEGDVCPCAVLELPRPVREHGPWGCDCPSCLSCVGSCRRCGERDPVDGEELCGQCEVRLEAEINSGGVGS